MVDLDRNKLEKLFASSGVDAYIDELSVVLTVVLENGDRVTPYLKFSSCNSTRMPRFFLPAEQWERYSGLPHIDPDGGICAFDHTSSCVDPRLYTEAVVSVAIKTVETLNNTTGGRCLQDFNDELRVYWGNKSKGADILSFVDEWPSGPMVFCAFVLGARMPGGIGVVEEKDLHKYERLSLLRQGVEGDFNEGKFSDFCIDECLYIPFDRPLIPPLSDSVYAWYETISAHTSHLEAYESFLFQNQETWRDPLIICGIPKDGGGVTAVAFQHPSVPAGSQSSIRELVRGGFGFERVEMHNIRSVSQKRLFARGGIGRIDNLHACLVGCGSLGGHLGIALMSAGVTDFTLVDTDVITEDNIARHVCGFDTIGRDKVEAVKQKIESHNPNCICETYNLDAGKLVGPGKLLIKDADMIFITAADAPLEYSFVTAFNNGIMDKPIALLWIEPYSLAAHAIVLNRPLNAYEEFFNHDMEFRDKVVVNASQMYKRDAGCNSMYMPYSGLDAQTFVIAFVRQLFDEYIVNHDKNYLFTWIGAVSKAEEYGAKISCLYQGISDHSIISREL